MLRNISFPDSNLLREIDNTVGESFSLKARVQMKGVGSPRMFVIDASQEIKLLTQVNQDICHCNIELRKEGVIIRFRSLLETYGLIIAYRQLSLYQNAERWQFHCGSEFITAVAESNSKSNRKFLIKLMGEKARFQEGPNS